MHPKASCRYRYPESFSIQFFVSGVLGFFKLKSYVLWNTQILSLPSERLWEKAQITKTTVHHPSKFPGATSQSTSTLHTQRQPLFWPFHHRWVWRNTELRVNGIIKYSLLCDYFPQHGIALCIRSASLCIPEWYSIVFVYYPISFWWLVEILL